MFQFGTLYQTNILGQNSSKEGSKQTKCCEQDLSFLESPYTDARYKPLLDRKEGVPYIDLTGFAHKILWNQA